MNDPTTLEHPAPEQLFSYGLGYLDEVESAVVHKHLEVCPGCRAVVEALPDDSLTTLVRAAGGRLPSPPDNVCQPGEASAGRTGPFTLPEETPLPAALAEHPRYRVLGLLGAGGMGAVFKAEHLLMGRVVALKVIHPRLVDRPAAVERFRQEVRAAARLSHPNIVTAHDADQAGDSHFLVMEFVAGTSLDRCLEPDRPLAVADACDWIRQAALGLQHAFERGMVHRDLKPQNLLLTPEGQVKILDFGLARFLSETDAHGAAAPEGVIVGTPDYMAPEQGLDARQADIRADVYGLGCTLYHLLAGQPPFPGGTLLQKLLSHQERLPRPLPEVRPDVPRELARVIERLLAKDPAQRYQTPAEVVRALAPFVPAAPNQAGTPIQAADWPSPGLRPAPTPAPGLAPLAWIRQGVGGNGARAGGATWREASCCLPWRGCSVSASGRWAAGCPRRRRTHRPGPRQRPSPASCGGTEDQRTYSPAWPSRQTAGRPSPPAPTPPSSSGTWRAARSWAE